MKCGKTIGKERHEAEERGRERIAFSLLKCRQTCIDEWWMKRKWNLNSHNIFSNNNKPQKKNYTNDIRSENDEDQRTAYGNNRHSKCLTNKEIGNDSSDGIYRSVRTSHHSTLLHLSLNYFLNEFITFTCSVEWSLRVIGFEMGVWSRRFGQTISAILLQLASIFQMERIGIKLRVSSYIAPMNFIQKIIFYTIVEFD